jgi:patatin-like phospholipase/acyl hydrolase
MIVDPKMSIYTLSVCSATTYATTYVPSYMCNIIAEKHSTAVDYGKK